jgi:hypothetical protein
MRISRALPIAIGASLVLLTGVADATSTTCATSVVCAEYINSSSGVAVHGEANTGIGIRGTSNGSTGFYGASRSGSVLFPGVEGESLKQTGTDAAGAFGLTGLTASAASAYGVFAIGSLAGGFGATVGSGTPSSAGAPTSVGIEGNDSGGTANADANIGVYGKSNHGTAVAGFANISSEEAGLLGEIPVGILGDSQPEAGETGMAGEGVGVLAESASIPVLAYNSIAKNTVELALQAYLIYSTPFTVDSLGNVAAKSLTTSKGAYIRTAGASGTARMSYSAQTTAPVMEDFGEAQLVNGRGYVKLDPALSDVIDNRNAYHVFLTPEGDSNGLYVSQKTPAGFMVREQHAGRSTLAFEYRILAKPFGNDAQRLALAPALEKHDPFTGLKRRPRSASAQLSLDPLARLEAHLGPAEYARELKAARKIETVP